MEFKHTSVLLDEVLDNLAIRPDGIYVDGTLGGGGHSYHILERLTGSGRLIGIDQDTDAIAAAAERLAQFGDKVTIVHDNYEHMAEVLDGLSVSAVDGILLDLGVSSYQLDNPERGFSYRTDAPLDMRMDRSGSLTAREIVNTYSQEELTRILREYGEERCAAKIAANIVKERAKTPLETTGDLSRIIRASIPGRMREKGGNPDKRTFQAIRIACNRELDVLRDSLDSMIDRLSPGGRLCVITFHSLEDRIVKQKMAHWAQGCTCPKDFPVCVCGNKPKVKLITRKPVCANEPELTKNPRARSAKLRICEKL